MLNLMIIQNYISQMNNIIQFEIPAFNPEKTVEFYSNCFDWNIKKSESSKEPYWIIETSSNGISGGITRKRTHDQPLVNTIQVESIDKTIELIEDNDGEIIVPKTYLPKQGYIIYFKDPEDNVFACMELI